MAGNASPGLTVLDLESIGLPEIPCLGKYRFRSASGRLLPHMHPGAWEICYLAEGQQVYRTRGRDYALSPGDIFVTPPDEIHGSGSYPQGRGTLYWFQIRPPARNRPFLCMTGGDAAALTRRLRRLRRRLFHGSDEYASLFDALWDEVRAPDHDLKRVFAAARLIDMLGEVFRCEETRRKSPPGMGDALEYIEREIEAPLVISEVAEAVGLSASWFKARFRREIGMPPNEYILRRKVERAKALLAPGVSVTKLAHRLGFSSSQYFAYIFRRLTGMTPTEHADSRRV